ncbi:hypothetical protein MKX03_025849, partial [Papaver bracteatum]
VIGRLHSMSNIVIKQVEEHDETKDTMKITLWGELATMIDDGILDSNENTAVIIIVTGTFVKERMGLIGLSTTQASRLFVNLDCEQVHQFRMRIGEETGEIEEIHLEHEKDPFEDKISLYEASQMLMDFENTEDDEDTKRDEEMEEDLDDEEDNEDENNENAMVKKSKTTTEQKINRLRRMVLEDDEDTQEDGGDEKEGAGDEGDEDTQEDDEDEKEGAGNEGDEDE